MTYGRFEVRMRSAGVSGMLSSFFTYYDPASPWNEIDIENMGRYTNESQFNTIVPANGNNHVFRQVLPFNPHAAFHTYGIEWTPEYVAWRIDGDEVYRQTGDHIALITKSQKLMMNVWQPSDADWAGAFSASQLPVYAYYDWIKYYSYTPGVGDNFTLQWTDDLLSFDTARWQKATHTWDGNNAQFVTANAVIQGGYLILCLTSNTASGYSGGTVVDTDVDPPYIIDVRAFDSTVVVHFNERLDPVTAEATSTYFASGMTFTAAHLRPDGRTVELTTTGLPPGGTPLLIVQGLKDLAVPANATGLIYKRIVLPISLPVRIDVGGAGNGSFLPDSVWEISRQYGCIGGRVAVLPAQTVITNTTEPEIYRSSRHGVAGINVRVPNGTYRVTLQMVEDTYAVAGKRVMSAHVQGDPLFTDLDLYQQAGLRVAYTAVAPAAVVTENLLAVWMGASNDSTTLSGLIIERIEAPTGVNMEPVERYQTTLDVYPNPTNGTATLRYTLAREGNVEVTIFDNNGRKVESYNLGSVSSGTHTFAWSAPRIASGVYFCALRSEGMLITRKVMMLR
jgi:hypothetical protein